MKGRMKGRAGFIFQYVIRRRNFAWWTKYNCKWINGSIRAVFHESYADVLSAALDAGLAVSIIFIFLVLQYPANGSIGEGLQHWWGNTVYYKTADGMGTPVRQLQGSETFGPSIGSW
ncbi:uncharacterized protein F5891DRAFT_1180110 [Suillus fuscotomentosus]|uniref:Uncharacterized protein n=1 Tax=Suillus fuscotomentosus TaxID=1912939 RepID=A0AAD4EM26_9AGAM|nr:uncharacterized protein F5891DRAFT_1180110 [Suillus fuscotomentosus]KAG1908586.1 hypothetical protein F5891DRAFT_1180110 [Suillus fuscotomentosus]